MSIDDVLFNVLFTNLISIGAAENLKLEAQSSEAPEKKCQDAPNFVLCPLNFGGTTGA